VAVYEEPDEARLEAGVVGDALVLMIRDDDGIDGLSPSDAARPWVHRFVIPRRNRFLRRLLRVEVPRR
jgi:hypothetical protein